MRYRTTAALATAIVLTASVLLAGGTPQSFAASSVDLSKKNNGIIQHVINDGTLEIDSIDLWVQKKTPKTSGEIIVEILQEGQLIASDSINTDDLSKKRKFKMVTAELQTEVTGDFDIQVLFDGKGGIKVQREKASKSEFEGYMVGKKAPKGWNLKLNINNDSTSPPQDEDNQNTPPPPPELTGQITVYAYRIPSEHWGPTFKDANAAMYFVVYNAVGEIVDNGYANEDGTTIAGLESGVTYWISPTDCEKCHGGDHDVRFHHWEDGSTERQRPVVASDSGPSVGAYYEYVPPPSPTDSIVP